MRCRPSRGTVHRRHSAPSTAPRPRLRTRWTVNAPKPRRGAPFRARGLTAPTAAGAQSKTPSEAKQNRRPCLRTSVGYVPGLYTSKSLRRATNFRQPAGKGRVADVAPQHRKESNADAERRCTQNTLMLPCGSKTVDHAFDIDGHALPASSHRWSGGAVPIRVFCVHRLAASAMKFLLCGAADRCWRTHCQARVGAHASGATPWHSACMAPRFGCGQRLRCAFCVHHLPASALRFSWPAVPRGW
jgi:hypothetical protein